MTGFYMITASVMNELITIKFIKNIYILYYKHIILWKNQFSRVSLLILKPSS